MELLLTIVFPIFGIVAAGFICGRFGLLGADSSEALNRFVYWVALPSLLFGVMAKVDIASVFNWPFIAGFAGASAVVWALASIAGRLLFRLDLGESSLHGLNSAYPNTGYMGIPLVIALYGEDATLPAILATIISVLSVALSVAPIEIAKQEKANVARVIADVLLALARNPMIVAPCAGLGWAATGLGLTPPLDTFLSLLGAAAGPCALFAIGLFLVGKPLTEGSAEIAVMTVFKLIVHPALTALAVLMFFDMDPLWANVAIIMAALPIGSGPFVLAQASGLYVRRTSTVMLATTVLSLFTISVLFLIYPVN